MRFKVENGERFLDLDGDSHHDVAVHALKLWHVAEERVSLSGLLSVKRIGPCGGIQKEKTFSTVGVLDELGIDYIATGGNIITMPDTKPEITQREDVGGSKWLALKRATYNWTGEKPKTWEYVVRPTRKGKYDAVVIVAFLDGCLVVIREFRIPIDDYELGFPAGLIDGDEAVETAAKRELEEETGLKMGEILCVTPALFSSPGMTNENVVMVFCEASGEIVGASNEEERIEVLAINLKGVEAILQDPPCSLSQRFWTVLMMMKSQGFVGWSKK